MQCNKMNIRFSFQIASVVTLPFDVVKTRRQVELGERDAKKCNHERIRLNLFAVELSV